MSDEPKRDTMVINGEEVPVLVYSTGLVKHAETGHFIRPPDGTSITTSERGRELLERKRQLKRERIHAGANEAVKKFVDEEGKPKFDGEGLDWVEALAEAQMGVVLKSGNRSTEAARLLLHEAGLDEPEKEQEPKNVSLIEKLGRETVLAFLAQRERERRQAEESDFGPARPNVIDAE